jgi:hypothetical protein
MIVVHVKTGYVKPYLPAQHFKMRKLQRSTYDTLSTRDSAPDFSLLNFSRYFQLLTPKLQAASEKQSATPFFTSRQKLFQHKGRSRPSINAATLVTLIAFHGNMTIKQASKHISNTCYSSYLTRTTTKKTQTIAGHHHFLSSSRTATSLDFAVEQKKKKKKKSYKN